MRKAKEEMQRIEEFKLKFRQSAFGGVFTNQLANVKDKIKEKHGYKESVKEEQVEIKADIVEESNHDNGHSKKKKKKKKKKSALKERVETDEEEKLLLEQHQSMTIQKTSQQQEEQMEKEPEKVDWDELNRRNARQQQNQEENEEEEKMEIERRKKVCSYEEIKMYFLKEVNLTKQIEEIQKTKEDFSRQSLCERLSMCFMQQRLNTEQLSSERDLAFALTRVKLDTSIAEHEILIKSIYKKLTNEQQCRLIGNHWVDIGFQGSDPKTDIRGTGILGLVHIIFFIGNFPKAAQLILKYSQTEKVEFPLAVKMLEFTILVIKLMREGKLYPLCNENNNVFETLAQVYSSLFLKFMVAYISGGKTIIDMNDMNQDLERSVYSNINNTINGFYMIADHQAEQLIKDALKKQRLLQQQKLTQIAKQAPQYEIQEFAFKPKGNIKKESQQQRGRNYQSTQNEEANETQKKRQNMPQNDEFSAI